MTDSVLRTFMDHSHSRTLNDLVKIDMLHQFLVNGK